MNAQRGKNGFDCADALGLWNELVLRKINAVLSFSHHDRMMPSENYAVVVPVGPGRFPADKLREVMAVAEEHGCETHLLGDGLRLMPKLEARP